MPARSKSQQRLFGMVHAYNKGELHGSHSLLKRVAALSKRMSDYDVRHFAETKHKGLPETKEAQVVMRPSDVEQLYSRIPSDIYTDRSYRRRSFLGRVFSGAVAGTILGGAGAGALGAFLANRAAGGSVPADVLQDKMREAGIRCGLLGAGRGAIAGAITGIGLGVLDKIRGES